MKGLLGFAARGSTCSHVKSWLKSGHEQEQGDVGIKKDKTTQKVQTVAALDTFIVFNSHLTSALCVLNFVHLQSAAVG